jgi:hypothetical protein
MTPRQAKLAHFWIGAKGGMLSGKHIDAMGMSVWLFLYLLRGQTGVNETGSGIFQYGHSITLEQISRDMTEDDHPVKVRTLRNWLTQLRRGGYIYTESHSSHGVSIWIAKAKDKTKKPRVTTKVMGKFAPGFGQEVKEQPPTNGRLSENSPPEGVASQIPELEKPLKNPAITSVLDIPTPKDLIPKNLSNYNNAAAPPLSARFKALGNAKSIPRAQTQKEEDRRRRMLLNQARELIKKYPLRGNDQTQKEASL